MKTKYIAAAIIFLMLVGLAWALVPPPPANQVLGIHDTTVDNFNETLCRNCHSSGLPDRHHILTGPPTYEYGCQDCHPVIDGGFGIVVDRDCVKCHNGTGFYANPLLTISRPHHNTTQAQTRACEFCHGSLIDNYADGHYIPPYEPSLVTPDPSYKVINETSGKKWGGCESCHEPDNSTLPPLVQNTDSHHDELFGTTQGASCGWCHNVSTGAVTMRACENCHGIKSLHNIQYNYNGTKGTLGYGHLGANWDCNGCHAWYVAGAEAPLTGAVVPSIDTVNPGKLTANTATDVTVTGTNFLQDNYTTTVTVNGASLTPTTLTDTSLVVSVNLAAGEYTLQVVKGDAKSKLASLTVVNPVTITSAKLRNGLLTIRGSGFGSEPANSESHVTILHNGNTYISENIVSWSSTKIEATSSVAALDDTATVTISSGAKSKTITR